MPSNGCFWGAGPSFDPFTNTSEALLELDRRASETLGALGITFLVLSLLVPAWFHVWAQAQAAASAASEARTPVPEGPVPWLRERALALWHSRSRTAAAAATSSSPGSYELASLTPDEEAAASALAGAAADEGSDPPPRTLAFYQLSFFLYQASASAPPARPPGASPQGWGRWGCPNP